MQKCTKGKKCSAVQGLHCWRQPTTTHLVLEEVSLWRTGANKSFQAHRIQASTPEVICSCLSSQSEQRQRRLTKRTAGSGVSWTRQHARAPLPHTVTFLGSRVYFFLCFLIFLFLASIAARFLVTFLIKK